MVITSKKQADFADNILVSAFKGLMINMALIILINAILGLFAALLYYPESPLYIFSSVRLEELWLWSKYAAALSALLFVFALLSVDRNIRGRNVARIFSTFATTFQGMLNLLPAVLYAVLLQASLQAQLSVRGTTITISAWELLLHVAIVILSWSTASWLVFARKNRELEEVVAITDPTRIADAQAQ